MRILSPYEITTLQEMAVDRAFANEGFGEMDMDGDGDSNNEGPFITALGGKQGDEWCALFAGHCWRRAYKILDLETESWVYRSPGVAEPGARKLYNGLWSFGCRFKDPGLATPGDLICWDRGHGKGHVELIIEVDPDDILHTMAGNVGRAPTKVKRLSHDVRKEPNFVGIATRRPKDMVFADLELTKDMSDSLG